VARHATIPESEKNQRISQKILPIVKKHIPKSPSQNDPKKRRASDEVAYVSGWNIAVAPPGKMEADAICGGKRQHVGETIPPESKALAELNQKGTEIMNVVSKHRRSFLLHTTEEASAAEREGAFRQ
jgi:hypothetical protein